MQGSLADFPGLLRGQCTDLKAGNRLWLNISQWWLHRAIGGLQASLIRRMWGTLPEMATLLKVADKTVYTMAQRAEIPAFKVRGQWSFKRQDIDLWIEKQKSTQRDETGRSI